MTRPKRSAAVAKPKTFFALFDDSAEEDEQSSEVEEVEAAPRKRSRSETTTPTQKNHNSTGEADPTNALNAAFEKMVERKMNEMREEMNALIAKQRTSNDELQRLRTELAKEKALNKKLKDGEKCDNSSIGVKKIGELDVNVFKRACEKRFPAEEAEIRGVELCSTWEQKLNGLSWNAFRMVDNKRVVNEGDASLVGLKKELGEEACNAVVTAIKDLYDFNTSRCVRDYEVWNFKENRKAKLEEVISWLKSGRKEVLGSSKVVVSLK